MDGADTESELRSVIADGLVALDKARGGRYMSQVARTLGVERSTVSRWRQRRSTASPEHCEELADHWPDHFDGERLLDLHFRSIHAGSSAGPRTAGLEILTDAGAVLEASTAELQREPKSATDRVLNHVAFHLERVGGAPFDDDPTFGPELKSKLVGFQQLEALRARQGWTVRIVVSAGNISRFQSIEGMVRGIEGPNVEIHAYDNTLPMAIAPLSIARRVVFMVHDHRRWERPGAALLIRSRAATEWADNYFSGLIADAPFRLRSPAGVDEKELTRYQQNLADQS